MPEAFEKDVVAMPRPTVEEALSHAGLAVVVGEVSGPLGLTGSPGLLLRRPERLNQDLVEEPTAARTRWKITAMLSAVPVPWSPSTPGLARASWQLDLLRCRGGEPRTFLVEAPDATGRLGLLADAANRSVAEGPEARRAANG